MNGRKALKPKPIMLLLYIAEENQDILQWWSYFVTDEQLFLKLISNLGRDEPN